MRSTQRVRARHNGRGQERRQLIRIAHALAWFAAALVTLQRQARVSLAGGNALSGTRLADAVDPVTKRQAGAFDVQRASGAEAASACRGLIV